MNRQVYDRIREAEGEYHAASLAVARLLIEAGKGQADMREKGLSHADIRRCQCNLEATYIVRVFAQFEATLRTFWRPPGKHAALPRTYIKHLMDKTATRTRMPHEVLQQAQQVRDCRNGLVHEEATGSQMTLAQCRSHLCRFLSHLPQR